MTDLFRTLRGTALLLLMSSIGCAYGDPYNLPCEEVESCLPCQPACWGQGFVSADLLYWRAFNSGLNTCIPISTSDIVTSNGSIFSKFSGKSRNPHFEWNPGFRISAGYEAPSRNWDIVASWAHFYSKAHESENNENRRHWNLTFDAIDLVAGYNADLCSYFVLRPFGGLRAARIDQKMHTSHASSFTSYSSTSYYSSSSYYSSTSGENLFQASNKQKFSGIGPLIGLEAVIDTCYGFSVYGSLSVSWLYGNFHVLLEESNEFAEGFNSSKIRSHLDANVAATDAALGVRWQTCICKNMQLILQLGLEHHRYFDYNRLGGYGDLSFDGANFSAGIEF